MKSLFEPVVGCFENVKGASSRKEWWHQSFEFSLVNLFFNYFATFVVINQSINQSIDDGDAFLIPPRSLCKLMKDRPRERAEYEVTELVIWRLHALHDMIDCRLVLSACRIMIHDGSLRRCIA
ncbi:hypothetical protein I7I48_06299 [Histoplasma ohiense]|nr:hypothetical protein I7I48_06299 [Histoplasma ohiense (nom. inval.)]